jgi:hypothetical protein
MPAPDPNFFAAHAGAPAKGAASKRGADPAASKRQTGRLPTGTATLQMSAPSSISEALADVSQSRPEAKAASPTQVDGQRSRKNRRSSRPPPGNGASLASALDDIDESFDKILSSPSGSTEVTAGDIEQVQGLFKEIAAKYLGPVRDLMIEIELGEPTKEWLSVCLPAVTSLKKSADSMGLTDLVSALNGLAETMDRTAKEDGAIINKNSRESLKTAYRALVLILPDAFAVEHERDRREPTIVLSLLKQVPEVRQVALDKLYAAGLTSLEMFYKASASDIAAATGLETEICDKVVDRFQRYRRERGSVPPAASRNAERSTLEKLIVQLEKQNKDFENSAKNWKSSGDKRKARQEREQTLVDIQLLLARLGEVDLVERIERAAFQRKAEELRKYLSTLK